MPDLPSVNQDFTADSSGYLAALQEMIDMTDRLISQIDEATAAIKDLHREIDDLPDTKVVNIIYRITTEGRPPDAGAATQVVQNVVENVARGGTVENVVVPGGDNAQQIAQDAQALAAEAQAAREAAAAQEELAAATARASAATAGQIRDTQRVAAAIYEEELNLRDIADAQTRAWQGAGLLNGQLEQETAVEQALAEEASLAADKLKIEADAAAEAAGTAREHAAAMREQEAQARQLAQAQAAMAQELRDIDAAERAHADAIDYSTQQLWEEGVAENRVVITDIEHSLELGKLRAAYDQNAQAAMQNAAAIDRARAAVLNANKAYADADQAFTGFANAERVVIANTDETGRIIGDASTLMAALGRAIQPNNRILLALAKEAKDSGSSIGQMVVPLGAAAFGAGGAALAFGITAGGLHLIVMGTFEFLAVFIPAMYAAAAAAAVMSQGVQNVKTQLQTMQTTTSALGDMLGVTSGDVLGLGHSLKTAQDLANPKVYQLLGEAILGVQAAMGKVNPQTGLSAFGQLGLDVTQMLNQFGAKMVVTLRDNMGKVTSLLSNAATALREFGQILGNIGHAIFNFAAAMPGAAELALKLIDALSQLLKWFSSLPGPILTAIFVIEELYRWSGVLVGVFGLVGRAIAAVGTLGIPVFGMIGLNFGKMVANIIGGVGGAIINFVAMGERIGIFGAKVDKAATGIVGALGKAADFMTTPWGAAIAVGVVALGVLAFALSHTTSATQDFINGINKSVSSASNLTVLNAIGTGMQQTVQKTNQALQTLNQTIAKGPGASSKGAWELYGSAVSAAGDNVQQLTGEQQKLFQQNMSVVQGASTISKAYGVDFAGALALADIAGVKLANNQVILGKNANQAGIQIEGLVQGYAQMNQTGSILGTTMAAINIQAGLQASKVSQVNQAWDQFIQLSTGLTGAYSQFNLDLQQMGNQAQTTGAKIRAFSGTTQLSVDQIAQSLKSFSGGSAQIWQSFNQSVSQANTFMDNLRTASAAGVVSQKQYTQAIASVVQQLQPYAKYSSSALAEVMALAQEAGGPAYDASKSLAANYQALAGWTDKNAISSQKFGGLIDTLTQKISNVTAVAKNFAGTLQSDVLNAIASAGANMGNITTLTNNFNNALANNPPQSKAVKSAQDALTAAMKQYGFSAQAITQVEQILINTHKQYQGPANAAAGATKNYSGSVDWAKVKSKSLADEIRQNLDPALSGIPKSTQIGLTESAKGTFSLGGMTITGQQALQIAGMNPLKHAGGGVIPGYSPGHDTVPAMLSPGEGILTPQAVKMLGAGTVHNINRTAQHFAAGGIVGFPDIGNLASESAAFPKAMQSAFSGAMAGMLGQALKGLNQKAAVSGIAGGYANPISVQGNANINAWIAQALAATGAPSSWAPDLLAIAMYESGFNPNAINLTDSNAAAGDPSRGLMQTIMTTFNAYHQPGTSWNIYDPVANIAAAIRYIEARYGTVFNTPGIIALRQGKPYVGYDSGGYLMPGLTMAYNGTGQPERVSPPGAGEGTVIHNVVNLDGQTIWENQQQYTLRYGIRNTGRPTGVWAPQ